MAKKKKILIIDDSALMRRILCDIIQTDDRYEVTDFASNGMEALQILQNKRFDCIFLDIHMPKMNGIEFLKEMQKNNRREKIIVVSSSTAKGEKITIEALSLGAFDFLQKPESIFKAKDNEFQNKVFNILEAASPGWEEDIQESADTSKSSTEKTFSVANDGKVWERETNPKESVSKEVSKRESFSKEGLQKADNGSISFPKATAGKKKIVVIATSTGGPNALQKVVPFLPKNLAAPVLIVQHMPAGFTKTLAERLNLICELNVKEAEEGEPVRRGNAYVAQGGRHLKFGESSAGGYLYFSDEPPREGVRPCANYLYESLVNCHYDEIVCVVMTGMGCDGTEGIINLAEKKRVHIIAQSQNTCIVYGMPKSIVASGKVNQIVDLDYIAQEIIKNVGVR